MDNRNDWEGVGEGVEKEWADSDAFILKLTARSESLEQIIRMLLEGMQNSKDDEHRIVMPN